MLGLHFVIPLNMQDKMNAQSLGSDSVTEPLQARRLGLGKYSTYSWKLSPLLKPQSLR